MKHLPRRDVSVRTPSSAMLVQMLFVMSAIGTGAVSALVTWLGPRADEKTKPSESAEKKKKEASDEG